MTDSQPIPQQQSWDPEIVNFMKLLNKFEFPDKRGFELMGTRKADFCPPSQPPFIN